MRHFILSSFCVACLSYGASAGTKQDGEVMRRETDGTVIVNTRTLGAEVRGFRGTTPIELYIKKGKILKVVALENKEDLKFIRRVERNLLPQYEGLSIKKLKKAKIDATSGATYSSRAIQENVHLALEYYKKHK